MSIEESRLTLIELQDALQIDKYDLDGMLIQQPILLDRVGQEHATAVSLRDHAKAQIEEVVAELDADLREEAVKHGTKITESQVSNLVKISTGYKDAYKNYLDLKELSDKWSSLLSSFSTRAYVLRDLVALHLKNYYMDATIAGPRKDATERNGPSIRETLSVERERRRQG